MDFTKPFRELWERKLWPVALLLLVLVAALPVLLGRDAAPRTDPAPVAANAAASEVEPVVDAADPARREAGDTVLGRLKDPFRPAVVIKAKPKKPAAKAKAEGGGAGGKTTSSGGGGGGGATSGSGGGTGTPAATATPAPTPAPTAAPTPTPVAPVYPLQSLTVRFGTVAEPSTDDRTLARLSGLPRGATPAVLYLGLLDDRQTGVFLVADGVTVLGDGTCEPSPTHCETLRMRKGDIEFIGVDSDGKTAQYQLEVRGVHTRRTRDASIARAARTRTARDGREWLRTMMTGHAIGLRYDKRTGLLAEG